MQIFLVNNILLMIFFYFCPSLLFPDWFKCCVAWQTSVFSWVLSLVFQGGMGGMGSIYSYSFGSSQFRLSHFLFSNMLISLFHPCMDRFLDLTSLFREIIKLVFLVFWILLWIGSLSLELDLNLTSRQWPFLFSITSKMDETVEEINF